MPSVAFEGDGFTIRSTVVGPLDNNVFVVVDDETGQSLIVDAADSPPNVIDLAHDTDVQAVLTTHGHWDHHQAASAVSEHFKVPAMLHAKDHDISETPHISLAVGSLQIGTINAEVVHTPGHTPGSVCLVLPGVVLTGDTLFPGGPGATRFAYSSFPQIIDSIADDLFSLPDDTVVLPGHGDSTTIGTERPELAAWIERGW